VRRNGEGEVTARSEVVQALNWAADEKTSAWTITRCLLIALATGKLKSRRQLWLGNDARIALKRDAILTIEQEEIMVVAWKVSREEGRKR
jgi:hypothetical protein